MQKVVTAAEMREIDRLTTERHAVPSLLLMEAAADASARAVASLFPETFPDLRVLILCGRGNNGGDGAALARILWTAGAHVEILLFGRADEACGDARANFEIARQLASADAASRLRFLECPDGGAHWQETRARLAGYDVLVDALFGTGLSRPLEGIFREAVASLSAVREARASGAPRSFVVSLDVPSGLDADSAHPIGEAVRADLTVTFTAPKPANVLPPASHLNGRLVVASIGSPASLVAEAPSRLFLTEANDARSWLAATRYAPDSFKNTHGHALIFAGSRGMTGAAVLTARAAMRSGAGLVTVASPASALPAVAARVMPEVMTAGLTETPGGAFSKNAFDEAARLFKRADVVAVGPGLTTDEETRTFVRSVVGRRTTPVVIDADGLNCLAPWPAELRGSGELLLVLTPHLGEMRRLVGAADEINATADRVALARDFASAHGLIVVLKGARTLVAAPDGRVFVNPTGNPGLGTAGSGDTLTGIITGFIAQSRGIHKDAADVLSAVLAAVHVGGAAGDLAAAARGFRSMVASDITEHLGAAVRALDPEGERP
ncbi:MAG TPA: NAD(P)H-hydrate dehydratase [Pyrinomonadaceae bacterium]|nr:NAD(P)H-hydrate dehydratase [Pyrinomonadaceae bacterium]